MISSKRLLIIVLTFIFTTFASISGIPAQAAVKKTIIPEVQFASAPVTEYTAGDRVQFNINSPNYGGKVEYRVVLWDDSKKSYRDLWNESNGYPNRYYTKWQPTGSTIFTLGWPIFEPGNYRITVYAKRVGVAPNKSALTGMNCDSYKQSVAFTVKPKMTLLDKEGQTYGTSAVDKLAAYKGDIKVTAKNILLCNAKIEGDLYISGDNAVIKNVSATGRIVVDPGKDGSTTLEDVTAKNIEVLSGGENSIHIKNVQAETMNVSSSTPVRVEADGDTEIVSTSASGYVIFDRKNGTYGTITITEGSDGAPVIEFRGDIKDDVQVETAATIKTAENSKVSNLVINTEKAADTVKLEGKYEKVEVAKEAKVEIGETAVITDSIKVSAKAEIKADEKAVVQKVDIATAANDTVKLEGTFAKVEINSQAKVEVAANTKIESIVANTNAEINVDKTAVVENVDKGSSTVVIGGEGTVGTGTTTPPAGGTGGGPTPPDPTPLTMSITSISATSATSVTFNSSIAGAVIRWNGAALPSQTVSGVNTITVPAMTSGASNALVIEKSGYTTFTKNNVIWTAMPNQEQVAPTGLAGVTPTSAANNDGKITGTTIAMEYKLESADDSTYTACSATETTVAAGTYLVRFAAKEGYNAGAAVTVTVPDYVAVAQGTIGLSDTLNGGINTTYTIEGYHMTFGGEIKYYQKDEDGAFMAGNWTGVKITAPEGITPGDDTVCTINNGEPMVGWGNIREEPDQYNYFYLWIKVRDVARTYSIEMKWNNEITETFLVDFAPSTTLELFKTDLGNMLEGARYNYGNAANYGNISDTDVQAFNDAINAAQEVYDNAVDAKTEAVQTGIYAAQNELMAAQDAFFDAYNTTIEALSYNMSANTTYTDADPLIITLSLTNGIGDFVTENTDYMTLGGDLSQMSIKSVTFEGEWATRAILELTGALGNTIDNAAISISEGGVNGHKHGFDAVAVPGAKGTIGLSDTLNGGINTTYTIDGLHMTFNGEIKYYQAEEEGAFIAGNWVGVKITAPEGITPGDDTVCTINNGEPMVGWGNIREEPDQYNYFYLWIRVRDVARTYSIEMKWNNEITETFLVDFAPSTTLELLKTDLGNMIDGARYNYGNAANYGEISDTDVQTFNDAINAAQEVYDNAANAKTEAVQAGIYAAQNELMAAQDAFFDSYNTTIEALSYNMSANTTYTDADPLIITLSLTNGIGDFVTENTDYMTLAGDLSQMSIKSVTFEGEWATRAILELTGTLGDTISNAAISIAEGGVNGHSHGFDAVAVPGAKGTIELSEYLNGGVSTTYTIDGFHMTFDGEIKYYQAEEEGAFIAGNWVGVKITAPEGIMPGDDTVFTIGGQPPVTGWDNIREEGDGDNYLYLFIRVRDITRTYSVEMKWNNQVTETFLVDFAPSTSLKVLRENLGDMINGARNNYNNAALYGEISNEAVQALSDAIDAAQGVYDNAVNAKTDAVQAGIYTAQNEITAAMDAFFDAYNTIVEAVSNNMTANTTYTEADPLIITLSLINGIGDFVTENTDYITLGGDLSQMSIKSVTFEGEPATRAILELIGTLGDTIDNAVILFRQGGIRGHRHGFDALAVQQ